MEKPISKLNPSANFSINKFVIFTMEVKIFKSDKVKHLDQYVASDLQCFIKKLDANMIEDTQLTDHTVIINFTHFEVNTINFLPN